MWPESRYLARMAAVPEAQETVLRIALAIPASENSRVHDDIADIALFPKGHTGPRNVCSELRLTLTARARRSPA
jgi:hypothetical protein